MAAGAVLQAAAQISKSYCAVHAAYVANKVAGGLDNRITKFKTSS